ncbi:MAG: Stp1/IreP family PP2C-type Ser/Thr phosphatase [Ignavibacteria bacterium]|nr:Stp1/IreP family PP2C-type Ser/Thr phosphatase [Ignavibacteria bacterium]
MSGENSFSVVFGNKTDVGKIRQRNEDYMECFVSPFGDVFVVCDGMGGHEGGEIASRLAVATIKQAITSNPHGLSSASSIIEESISLANMAITAKSEELNGLKGMGTTCVVLIVNGDRAFYGHVGDSRLYLVRSNRLNLMTKDHSFVQGLVDQGLIGWNEAEDHPRKNEITQALGIFDKINPEVNQKALQLYKGDKFILCSDGLTGPVPEETLLEVVTKYPPVEASNALIEAANNNGGPDNITVQIIEIANAKTLPLDKMTLPPEGAIDRSLVKTNATTKDFSYSASASNANLQKKRNFVPYIAICAAIVIITGLIVFNPFSGKEQFRPTVSDSTKTKDTTHNTVNDTIHRELESSLKELYKGKDTPSKIPRNITLSNPFEYLGIFDETPRKFDPTGLIMNIQKNDLKFENIARVNKEDSLNYSTDMQITYEGKLHTFKIRFRTKDSKNFELHSIKSIKQPSIEKEKVKNKKETEIKKTEKKPEEKILEPEKTDPVKPGEETKPKENSIDQIKTNENENKQDNFGK